MSGVVRYIKIMLLIHHKIAQKNSQNLESSHIFFAFRSVSSAFWWHVIGNSWTLGKY